jgi:hypothetical protein
LKFAVRSGFCGKAFFLGKQKGQKDAKRTKKNLFAIFATFALFFLKKTVNPVKVRAHKIRCGKEI